jgi:AraC family transcriptional regulator
MGHLNNVLVLDNNPKLPGVTEVKEILPGVTIALSDTVAKQAWEVRYCLDSHLLLFLLSPSPETNKFAVAGLGTGDFVDAGYMNLIPAQTPYRTLSSEGHFKTLSMQLDPERFDNATGIGRNWNPRVSRDIHNPTLEAALWRLARELVAPGFASRTLMEGVTLAVMADLSRVIKEGEGGVMHKPGTLSARQLKLITEYIDGIEESSPTISELAALVGVSTRYLTKAFKETTGKTVHTYVTGVRIRKAAQMLCGTDLPMKEVAGRLGFSALASFSNAFRAATGHTPTMFRKMFQVGGRPS